jgi:peroxiredoxin
VLKNLFVIVILFGLIGWGIYNQIGNNNQNHEDQQKISKKDVSTVVNGKTHVLTVGLEEGNLAPDFQLTTLDGTIVKLSDQKGKKIFLNFWASWCPPCKAEMPNMEKFYQGLNNDSVEILAVNLTTEEKNRDDVSKFVNDHGITFPILLDDKGKVGDTYQAITIPTTYVIDTNGIIRKKVIGPLSEEMMEKFIASIQ